MTDETFRQKFRYVLDHRVQAGALLSMVLQMLIVPGMPVLDILSRQTVLHFITSYHYVLLPGVIGLYTIIGRVK
jgi:hypothetical protein